MGGVGGICRYAPALNPQTQVGLMFAAFLSVCLRVLFCLGLGLGLVFLDSRLNQVQFGQ